MPDIKRFDNIVEAIAYLQPGHILKDCLIKDGVAINHVRHDAVRMPDGRIAFICNTGNCTFYRGETIIYKSCKSSLYRIARREDKICALAKTYEFMEFLKTLPEVQNYIENNLWYEPWALAQHYEFATPMIDLTNEIAVAAFFATHRYDPVTKSYNIVRDGIGQIRGLNAMPYMDTGLRPIGLQPFSRPSSQLGYGYWLPETDDLVNHTFSVEFKQNYEVNYRLDTAAGGQESKYFPNELLTRMASIIKNTGVVTNKAIDAFASDVESGNSYITPAVTRDEIISVLKEAKLFIVDAPVICPEAVVSSPYPFRQERRLLTKPAYKGII